ncbi:MAG: thiolase domain-containing protein [Nitrospinae bacterium]|nr:thiolase domain-containing protein [Nitrospinota bacterium]
MIEVNFLQNKIFMGVKMGTYIKGAGMTKFDVDHRNSHDRIYECVNEALDFGNMAFEDIDAIFVANIEPEANGERQKHTGPMLSSMFQRKLPILTVLAGCGGGGAALWNAINFQKTSNSKNVLVVGFEKLVTNTSEKVTDEMSRVGERIYEQAEGVIFPAQNALVAQQYMMKYGATSEDLALISLKNHENAYLNPKARFYGKKVTLDMIQNSPVVASPLRLFDCSISVDGAAAAIVSKEKSDVEIIGSALYADRLPAFEASDMTSWESTKLAAAAAYSQAGITSQDVDFAELHDAFTSVELMSYEDLGFAEKGEGKNLIKKGVTKINGKLPVNTSGGLKAKGHPVSATGISQIYEIVKQMRKQAGKRQIDKTRIGLAHNVGGVGSTATVHILKHIGG